MQRLRAIEQDWSTINDMRQDFESTKAKLKTLMHRELVPETQPLPITTRRPHAMRGDVVDPSFTAHCDPAQNSTSYQQHRSVNSTDAALENASDMVQDNRRVCDVTQTAGIVAAEFSKPHSQWHRYEERLRAREAEAEATELRAEVSY